MPSELAKRIAKGIRSIGWSAVLTGREPTEQEILEAYAKAADVEVADLIKKIEMAVEAAYINIGPSGVTGYETRGAFNDGVEAALAAIRRIAAETEEGE